MKIISAPLVAAALGITIFFPMYNAEAGDYASLEFDDIGVSFEVPSTWYAFDNGTTKMIATVASDILEKLGREGGDRMLISLVDEEDINNVSASAISVIYGSEVLVTQAQLAVANATQKKIVLDHWNTACSEGLRSISKSVEIVGDGEILKVGDQWFVKVTMNVQMRDDMPLKRKEVFIHMSQKGTIHLSFTCVPEKLDVVGVIRDYVLESLRMNVLRRTR